MSLTLIDYLILTNEDWTDSFVVESGDPLEPVDLTGSSFRAQIRATAESITVPLEVSTTNERLVIAAPASDGTVLWNVTAADIAARLAPGEYVYDVVWTNPDGGKDTIIAGKITVQRGVTR